MDEMGTMFSSVQWLKKLLARGTVCSTFSFFVFNPVMYFFLPSLNRGLEIDNLLKIVYICSLGMLGYIHPLHTIPCKNTRNFIMKFFISFTISRHLEIPSPHALKIGRFAICRS